MWLTAQRVAWVLLIIGLALAFYGFNEMGYSGSVVHYLLNDFYANVSTELISISITVILIGRLTERQKIEALKEELILQMGSPNNEIAKEAARKIVVKGWERDKKLYKARLENANLCNINLSGFYLEKARLAHADLSEADLIYSILDKADLEEAELVATDLSHATLEGAMLPKAKLQNSILEGANLIDTDLQNADLEWAIINDHTNFEGANINRANFKNTNITQRQINQTRNSDSAILPLGITPKAE